MNTQMSPESALLESNAVPERIQPERYHLLDEACRLSMEVDRLTEENVALRKSAEIWFRMYESLLAFNESISLSAFCLLPQSARNSPREPGP